MTSFDSIFEINMSCFSLQEFKKESQFYKLLNIYACFYSNQA